MKKLFTAVALAASVLTVSAADVISVSDLIAANPGAVVTEYNGDNEDKAFTFNSELSYKAASGITYDFTQIALTEDFFRFQWNYDYSSRMTAMNATQWIESIVIQLPNGAYQSVRLLGGDEPFSTSWDDRNGAAFKYSADSVIPDENNRITVNVNVPCHFIMFSVPQGNIVSLTVNWTSVKPVPTVETPVISCDASPVEVGSRVSIKTATIGATIHPSVYVNDQLVAQPTPWVQNDEWSSMSITLPGKAGDGVRVEAYATKEGWTQSETASWWTNSLSMSAAPRPTITKVGSDDRWIDYVIPGEQLEIAVNTTNVDGEAVPLEGAKVLYTYGWNDYDNEDNNFRSEQITADAPVILTVPENAPIGKQFFVEAFAQAEGYRRSDRSEEYIDIISDMLSAPTFNLEDGASVKAGGSLAIYRPNRATELHYTVNDGEEQVSTEWRVSIEVTEKITVTAWATGDAPFKPSEKVTVTVKPEKFQTWQDVLTYATFGLTNDQEDTSLKIYNSTVVNEGTGVNYVYRGGFYQREINDAYVNCFYMCGANYLDNPYLRNTNASINKVGDVAPVKTLQLDSYNNVGFFVFLSDTEITEFTDEMTNAKYTGTDPLRLTFVGDGNNGSDYPDHFDCEIGVTLYLDEFQKEHGTDEKTYNDKPYFAIVPVMANQGYYLERAVVGYNKDYTDGVESVEASFGGEETFFNLNGVKVSAEKLTPGIYVRVANGKSTKVVVR